MPTKTIAIGEHSSNSANRTLIGKVIIPGIERITKVTVSGLTASKIGFSINEETREVSVTLNSVPFTRIQQDATGSYPFYGSATNPNDSNYKTCYYAGTSATRSVSSNSSCPSSIVSIENTYFFEYQAVIEYEMNSAPTITMNGAFPELVRDGDELPLIGTVNDVDIGQMLTVLYRLNDGESRTITSFPSDNTPKPFEKRLVIQGDRLMDGETVLVSTLQESTPYALSVWVVDNKGGKSTEKNFSFTVALNQPPQLTLDPVAPISGLKDIEAIQLSGHVTDPNGHSVTVEYAIGSGAFNSLPIGVGGQFSISLPLTSLVDGENVITFRATDSMGGATTAAMRVGKTFDPSPLLDVVKRYRINIPSKKAQSVSLKVQREIGDLSMTAEISMTANAENESFQPMAKTDTRAISSTIEEDTFEYQAAAPQEKIVLKLLLSRETETSDKAVTRISGTLN